MYTTYHFRSATEINNDIVDAIKAAFKGKPVVITIEEEMDETALLLSNPANAAWIRQSIEQDRNGESIKVEIPKS